MMSSFDSIDFRVDLENFQFDLSGVQFKLGRLQFDLERDPLCLQGYFSSVE